MLSLIYLIRLAGSGNNLLISTALFLFYNGIDKAISLDISFWDS